MKMSRAKVIFVVFFILTVLKICTLCFLLYFLIFVETVFTGDNTVIITPNMSVSSIGESLYQRKIIRNEILFRIANALDTIYHGDQYMIHGEYLFSKGDTLYNIVRQLKNGQRVVRKITIPEGLTSYQIINIILQEDALKGTIEYIPKDGSLLPGTYFYYYGNKKKSVVETMKGAMQEALSKIWEERSEQVSQLSAYELLIMASIIEKEAANDEEKPIVSAVFHNRLKLNMRLQADPCVIYTITKGQYILDRSLTKKDLQIDSPYNTYKVKGLPPHPITNPGYLSIYASAHPSDVDYLYFVLGNDGRHNFSSNLRSHNKYVKMVR